jgi:hypothetical protein
MGIREYLDSAIKAGRTVTIKYIKYEGEFSVRKISNIQYSDEYGEDYIQAFCHKRQENRTFKISRIISVDDVKDTPVSSEGTVKKTKSAYTGNSTSKVSSSVGKSRHTTEASPHKSNPSYGGGHTYNKSYSASSNAKRNEGCYIATMAYGDYDHPQVLLLRKYRDERLMQSCLGRLFVKTYYFISPKLVKILRGHENINAFIRILLDKYIEWLNR